jgi:hypothetical protein
MCLSRCRPGLYLNYLLDAYRCCAKPEAALSSTASSVSWETSSTSALVCATGRGLNHDFTQSTVHI